MLPLPFILRSIYSTYKAVRSAPLSFIYLLPTIKHHNPFHARENTFSALGHGSVKVSHCFAVIALPPTYSKGEAMAAPMQHPPPPPAQEVPRVRLWLPEANARALASVQLM